MNNKTPISRASAASGGDTNKETIMAKVLVLYYSSWGHMEAMAQAAAKGAAAAGADVTIKRVP